MDERDVGEVARKSGKEGFEIPDYEEFLERKWIRLPDQEFPWLAQRV